MRPLRNTLTSNLILYTKTWSSSRTICLTFNFIHYLHYQQLHEPFCLDKIIELKQDTNLKICGRKKYSRTTGDLLQ